jgi:hypothetical protein
LQESRAANVADRRSDGTALMLAKHRVVEDAFRDTEVRLISGRRLQAKRIGSAFRQGLQAGDRVNLNRPVNDTAVERIANASYG